MIEAIARVERWERGLLTISWRNQSACGHCEQGDDCGTGIVAKAWTPKQNRLTLPSEEAYPAGTQLRIGIAEQDLLRLSAAVYLLPLLGGIGAAVLAHLLSVGEPLTILSCLTGGAAGFALARRWARYQPRPLTILGDLGLPISGS
ncbi:SoxR reducing system RseC family protein [Ferrimonas pelagia]|uniref:SoxR reducing system RseC family protein n=1 Tax=Ferrimonas pelagia TaxID=1177826 RepID=A0ABP9F9G7_9GAMM